MDFTGISVIVIYVLFYYYSLCISVCLSLIFSPLCLSLSLGLSFSLFLSLPVPPYSLPPPLSFSPSPAIFPSHSPFPSLPLSLSLPLPDLDSFHPPYLLTLHHRRFCRRYSPLPPSPSPAAPGRASPGRVRSVGASGRLHLLDGFQVLQEDLLWRHGLLERRLLVLRGKASGTFPLVVSCELGFYVCCWVQWRIVSGCGLSWVSLCLFEGVCGLGCPQT